jgi:bacteriocin biosynthesis cyclodehydratase domain-containing protein
MNSEIPIRLHPLTQWQRVDEKRLQVRFPSARCVTFDQHASLIEAVLVELSEPSSFSNLIQLLAKTAADREIIGQLLDFLQQQYVLETNAGHSPKGVMRAAIDFTSNFIEAAKHGLPTPFVSDVVVHGEGEIAGVVRQIVRSDNGPVSGLSRDASGVELMVACSDREDHALFRVLNADAVGSSKIITFLHWDGHSFILGPLVIPGESACYQCFLDRLMLNTHHPDELASLVALPARTAQQSLGNDAAFHGLVHYLAARHIGAIAAGLFHLVKPGSVSEWSLLEAKEVNGRVLKMPRCSQCSRLKTTAAPRSVRDLS